MAQARGSALTYVVSILLLCLLFNSQNANAETYQVGDAAGWTFGVSDWPNGKSFKAGDILEFIYDRAHHSVAIVNEKDYNSCTVPDNATVFQTGDDRINLEKGNRHYICAFPGHCDMGMKIAISVA